MITLRRSKSAIEDLKEIQKTDPRTVLRIVAIIEQLQADPRMLDKLLTNKLCLNAYEIKKWAEQQQSGNNLWFIKPWENGDGQPPHLPYRIIYSYTPAGNGQKAEFNILAVVHRNFNYEADHPITRRVLSDYYNL